MKFGCRLLNALNHIDQIQLNKSILLSYVQQIMSVTFTFWTGNNCPNMWLRRNPVLYGVIFMNYVEILHNLLGKIAISFTTPMSLPNTGCNRSSNTMYLVQIRHTTFVISVYFRPISIVKFQILSLIISIILPSRWRHILFFWGPSIGIFHWYFRFKGQKTCFSDCPV